MDSTIICRNEQAIVETADWGVLTWYANSRIGNSTDLTVGRCVIRPGMSNPKHSHINCSEVLVVEAGRIRHTVDLAGSQAELNTGDTITIPAGFPHHAENIGPSDAVLLIAFSSADRKTKGE